MNRPHSGRQGILGRQCLCIIGVDIRLRCDWRYDQSCGHGESTDIDIVNSQHPYQQNAQYCSFRIYVGILQYHIEYSCMFRSPMNHHQGIKSKRHRTKTNQQTFHTVGRCEKVKQLKYRHFLVVLLYKSTGSWYAGGLRTWRRITQSCVSRLHVFGNSF
jgi:hypothetical protein